MVGELDTFGNHVSLQGRHVIERPELTILVVRHDEHNIMALLWVFATQSGSREGQEGQGEG